MPSVLAKVTDIYVCIHTLVDIHIYAYIHTYVDKCVYVHTCIHTYECVCTCIQTYTHLHKYLCMFTYMYAYCIWMIMTEYILMCVYTYHVLKLYCPFQGSLGDETTIINNCCHPTKGAKASIAHRYLCHFILTYGTTTNFANVNSLF
jgi:hypothetical protein